MAFLGVGNRLCIYPMHPCGQKAEDVGLGTGMYLVEKVVEKLMSGTILRWLASNVQENLRSLVTYVITSASDADQLCLAIIFI